MYLCSMKIKLLQSIGNSILRGLEKANDNESIKSFYDLGIWFDGFCINYLDVYLD